MRTSKDIYKLNNGKFVAIGGDQEPPKNGKLWHGYNYDLQEWWFEGKKDIRTFITVFKTGGVRVKMIQEQLL